MFLHVAALGLVLITVLLAGPASAALSAAKWTSQAPRAALVLWQAVGLGGGLGVLTAGLTLAAADLDPHWLAGVLAVPSRWRELGIGGWCGMALTVGVGIYLVTATVTSSLRVLAARRAHRQRLDMLSQTLPQRPAASARHNAPVRLLDHPHAVAYGLPGFRPQVVLTRGALEALTDSELDAVLAHEQAHVRGRHDLVVQPFVAWAQTFPFLPTARRAVIAVGSLVEMLADNAALEHCRRDDLRAALGKLAGQHFGVTGHGGDELRQQLQTRMTRLLPDAQIAMPHAHAAAVYAAALLLVAAPPVLLICS
ncbi:MAG: M56 family metallopeptidase [Nakamurella sp.]